MTNLHPDICRKIKDARRERGISQSLLAKEVGCKQSALSMFEQGDGTKLCDKFGVKLSTEKAAVEISVVPAPQRVFEVEKGYCPNPNCPSHTAYEVDGQKFLKPDRRLQDPVGGKFCAICGEVLEKCCPNCGSLVHDGAVCSICGESYIAI